MSVEPTPEAKIDPPNQDQPNPSVVAHLSRSEHFYGPIPPPEYLARYEEVCPGIADRMLKMVEAESAHRQECEKRIIEAQCANDSRDFSEARVGQACAFAITVIAFVCATYMAINGHDIPASFVGVSGVGGIVATFIVGRHTKGEPAAQEAPGQAKGLGNRKPENPGTDD